MSQCLKNFSLCRITLKKSGVQLEILLDANAKPEPKPKTLAEAEEALAKKDELKLTGWEATPWLKAKTIFVDRADIAAMEIIIEPHIAYGDAMQMEEPDA